MILITATLISAIDGHAENLGEMVIANNGTSHDRATGNYDTHITDKRGIDLKVTTRGHDRDQTFWFIVLRALLAAEGFMELPDA